MITKVEKLSQKIIMLKEILATQGCKHARKCESCPFDEDPINMDRCNLNYELEQKGYAPLGKDPPFNKWEYYLNDLVEELIVN